MDFETIGLLVVISILFILSWLYVSQRLHMKKAKSQYKIQSAHTLGQTAALRDHETGAHNIRVAYIAACFGEDLDLNKATLQKLMKGAFLHDIGKIGIKDNILLKNGALDKEEFEKMQLHTIHGKKILNNMPFLKKAEDIVMYHHEKYDGTGYPEKLKGEEIPFLARVFAIIDVFDALLSTRPYKKAFLLEETLKILKDGKSTHFDPKLLDKFIENAPKYTQKISNKTEQELQLMLELKRKKIFGI